MRRRRRIVLRSVRYEQITEERSKNRDIGKRMKHDIKLRIKQLLEKVSRERRGKIWQKQGTEESVL